VDGNVLKTVSDHVSRVCAQPSTDPTVLDGAHVMVFDPDRISQRDQFDLVFHGPTSSEASSSIGGESHPPSALSLGTSLLRRDLCPAAGSGLPRRNAASGRRRPSSRLVDLAGLGISQM